MISDDQFPHLTESNHRLTSPPDVRYNCIAWSANDTSRWWQPGYYWPVEGSREDCWIGNLVEAFQSLGYREASDESLEDGFVKVALYASGMFYTHAARQLPNGKWTSKLGKAEDIEHDSPGDVAGGISGEVVQVMQRPLTFEG